MLWSCSRPVIAERGGEVVGSAVGCALERSKAHTGLARPDNAGFLGFAAVFPHAPGGGAGRALGEAVLGVGGAQRVISLGECFVSLVALMGTQNQGSDGNAT
jgi:hypothetical protein